ncbi:MAG: zinc ribbon domain-containing protein [Planctomycetes bacterium]|nr:zinc ribbon domain-containing protein [Planctomycetota bacterium]
MPLYDFVCQECHREQELLVRGEEAPKCGSCGSTALQKLLSVPAAHTAKEGPSGPPAGSCGSGCGCFPG